MFAKISLSGWSISHSLFRGNSFIWEKSLQCLRSLYFVISLIRFYDTYFVISQNRICDITQLIHVCLRYKTKSYR